MRGRQYGRSRVYRIETDGAAKKKKAGKEEGKRKRERGGGEGGGETRLRGETRVGKRPCRRTRKHKRQGNTERERERERDDIKFLSSPICK